MKTLRVGELARVEGHGGITVEFGDDRPVEARFEAYEGLRLFEGLVRGREWSEVPAIVSRICSICSAAHALTSIKAIENGFGITPPEGTLLLRELLFRGGSIESHALHLFLLAAPDYLGYPSAIAMAADYREVVAAGLELKKIGNTVQEVVGGRAIHPVTPQVGGFSAVPGRGELAGLTDALLRARQLAEGAIGVLQAHPPPKVCDREVVYAALRPSAGWGYYEGHRILFVDGVTRTVTADTLRDAIREHAVAHSTAKQSRLEGRAFMVGALARVTANRNRLGRRALEAMERLRLEIPSRTPLDNNKAQAVELVQDVEAALAIIERLQEIGPAAAERVPVEPRAGTGTAVTEAPRGLLLHCYTFDTRGVIAAADVITPTALNAARVEDDIVHAVEQNPGLADRDLVARLEMVARAFDPCISCSVHLIRREPRKAQPPPPRSPPAAERSAPHAIRR
jgi:sulfhydrogenase subunit alpha